MPVIERVWTSGKRKVKRTAWGYTVQIDGKQVRHFNAAWSKDDAEKAMAARLLGVEPSVRDEGLPVVTFKTLTDRYLLTKEAGKKKSIKADRAIIKGLLAFLGASTPLAAITAPRIAEYRLTRLTTVSERTKATLGKGTVNRELSVLRALMNLAADPECGFLEKAPRVKLEHEDQDRLRFLTDDEAVRLLDECKKAGQHHNHGQRSPYLYPVVVIALNTGMRREEILGLTWPDVDLTRGVFRLERTKTGRRREVPMNLAAYTAVSELPRTGSRLFPRSVRTAWEGALERSGVEDFRFHDLRHTFASWLVQKGRSLREVKELLGHSSITMTMRYSHLAPDHLKSAVAVLDAFSTTSAHAPASAANCPPVLTHA